MAAYLRERVLGIAHVVRRLRVGVYGHTGSPSTVQSCGFLSGPNT